MQHIHTWLFINYGDDSSGDFGSAANQSKGSFQTLHHWYEPTCSATHSFSLFLEQYLKVLGDCPRAAEKNKF